MELTPALEKKNILIVEDAISMRHTIKAALRARGFNSLIEAGDGDKALKIIKSKRINLVICDWIMPNMSGLELFNALKSDENCKDLPFILLTGNDQKDSITEALKAGIRNYVVKPFNPAKLFEKVCQLLLEQKQVEEQAG